MQDSEWKVYYPNVFNARRIAAMVGPYRDCVMRRIKAGKDEYRACTPIELSEAERLAGITN